MTSSAHDLLPRDDRVERDPATADQAPAQIELVLHEVLGRGGAAVVHRAFDPRLGRVVAVKLLPAAAALDPRSRERFLAEIRIAAALDHPHIVPVFATGMTDEAPYLEMQAIAGRSLDQVIADLQALARTGQPLTGQDLLELAQPRDASPETNAEANSPLPPVRATPCYYRQVARWLAALSSALAHVHARGFVHGDIKPANLLIEPSGHLWLIDFGTACELNAAAADTEHVAAGTLPYLAPERLDGAIAPDVRQDVYGLGATLYELLTLRRPFAGQTAQALMRELTTQRPIPPRKLARTTPRALEAIATRALARRPEDRFATLTEVEQALIEFDGASDDEVQRPNPRCTVRRCLSVAAALIVCALLVAAIYGLWPREPALAERAANLGARLPPGLRAELPNEQSPRLVISGVLQLGREPFELPLDLTTRDQLTWRIEPRPWLTHAGHSYTTTPHASGWLAAEALAQAWGGHLVAINDQEEQDFLNGTVLAKDARGQYPVLWIGLSAEESTSEYRWSSGEPLTFRNWNPGEPSRGWGVEQYVVANWHIATGIDGDGQVGDWNDVGEPGLRKGHQGIIELPHPQQSIPPALSLRRRNGSRTQLPPTGNRLPAPGRLLLELAGDSRQLVELTITVE